MDKKIVKLNGGLGNQMFQFAFSYALAKKTGAEILYDYSYFSETDNELARIRNYELAAFNLECPEAGGNDIDLIVPEDARKLYEKFLGDVFKIKKFAPQKNMVRQSDAYKYSKRFSDPKMYYYEGYYQNEKFFKEYRNELIECFSIKGELDEKNQSVIDAINSTESVSLHIRRGDYVTLQCSKDFHGLCPLDYYQKAIEYIAKKVKKPHFYLFSDDIDWIVKNLKIDYPYTIINFNQDKGWLDLNLMKNCKHNVIANSSFSWWAAWLNENPEKIVIAPKNWVAKKNVKCDIVPKDWVKL